MTNERRSFLWSTLAGGAAWLTGRGARGEEARAASPDSPADGRVLPVHTPHVAKLPYKVERGVKVFHLVAEPVRRELVPASSWSEAKVIDAWGYNGTIPGPTIEVVEGDRVRIVVTNKLPEFTSMHWHGLEVPIDQDGVPAISQPLIQPGETWTYEFTVRQNGTFFYHSHMPMQEMMGMIGFFIIHPRRPHLPAVQKDFGLILQEWALLPHNTVPNTLSMEFNFLTMNGKAGPAIAPLVVKLGERVRIRMVNLGMDHHPIHLHGHQFSITGTEGGRAPQSTWCPGNTVIVGIAQARDIEFDAKYPGDWMLHCHMPHHMMNQMISMVGPVAHAGHGMRTGGGMEEGMGMIRQAHALDEDLGPTLGRGMGMATLEKPVSNLVGPQEHPHHAPSGLDPKKVPGYPQDMWMVMDEAIDMPETYGMKPGWTGAMMGMMTVVRVLEPAMYEKVMAMVRRGEKVKPAAAPAPHRHGD